MAIKGNMGARCVVYMATSKISGKRYIGITSQVLEVRVAQHFARARRQISKGAFDRALRKYGRDGFIWVVLEECESVTVALAREIEIICSMRPEYNSTKGGDGARGYRMSRASRKRLSDFHKGRAWHNMPHSEETKARLAEIGRLPENMERWASYASLGPRSQHKAVICLKDGSRHESISSAARYYDVDIGTLVKVCKGRRPAVQGLVFKYEEAA